MFQIGSFELSTVNFTLFRLDGGAMFGSVPKNLWSKRLPADEQNRIQLASRSLLIRTTNRLFLVDVGMGDKWTEKEKTIYQIEQVDLPSSFDRSKITDVILTHLHFDHAGGISRFNATGELELTYPGARVFLQKENWENAQHPSLKERASYLKQNVEPLKAASLHLLKDSAEIIPGLQVHRVDGHTRGQQLVEIRAAEQSVLFMTDLVPTSHHLPIPFHMGYDACAEKVLKEKQTILERCEREKTILVFQHDPELPAGRIGRDEKGHFCVTEKLYF